MVLTLNDHSQRNQRVQAPDYTSIPVSVHLLDSATVHRRRQHFVYTKSLSQQITGAACSKNKHTV